jgi:hypothetical protein
MSLAKKINLRPNEEIISIIRAGFFSTVWYYLLGFLFLITASFFMFWLFAQAIWGYVVYGVVVFIGLYIIFRTWYFKNKNFSVITNERIVNVSRAGWFEEYISVLDYNSINEIFLRRQGLMSNLFNFGSIEVDYGDKQSLLILNSINYPQKVFDLIHKYKNNFVANCNLRDIDSVYEAFVDVIPDLTEEEICEVRDLLDKQLEIIDENLTNDV